MRRAIIALVVLAGCGGGGSKSTHSVTLEVAGGKGNLNQTACGKQEPFENFDSPAAVAYSGTVTPAPSGRWKVKVKIKECVGGEFKDVASQKIVGQPSGRFEGRFTLREAGAYAIRARLQSGDREESPKLYLKVG